MGLLRTALRTGLAAKAIDIARREASKPENQRKARDMFERVSGRSGKSGSGEAVPRSRPRRP